MSLQQHRASRIPRSLARLAPCLTFCRLLRRTRHLNPQGSPASEISPTLVPIPSPPGVTYHGISDPLGNVIVEMRLPPGQTQETLLRERAVLHTHGASQSLTRRVSRWGPGYEQRDQQPATERAVPSARFHGASHLRVRHGLDHSCADGVVATATTSGHGTPFAAASLQKMRRSDMFVPP